MKLSEFVSWTGSWPPRIWLCQFSAFAESRIWCQSEKFQGSWKASQGCQFFFLCWFSLIGTCCSFSSQQCKWYKSGRVLIRSSWKRITYWGFLLSWPYWLAWKRYQVLLQNYSRLHLPHVRRRLEHRLKDLPGYQMCHPLTPQDLGPRTLGPHPLLV